MSGAEQEHGDQEPTTASEPYSTWTKYAQQVHLAPRFIGFGQLPRGSKYPILKVSGSEIHTLNGFRNEGPQTLGTWTRWVMQPDVR